MFDRIHLWSLALFSLVVSKSQFPFQCLWLFCSCFLFLPGSVLEGFTFLRICQFLPSCPFYWHMVADSSLLWSFVFVLSVVISPFSFLILLIWFFSICFLISLANGLSVLFTFSKNQLLVFDFCYSLICFFYFCPNFYDFFPSMNPGLLHFFFFYLL